MGWPPEFFLHITVLISD